MTKEFLLNLLTTAKILNIRIKGKILSMKDDDKASKLTNSLLREKQKLIELKNQCDEWKIPLDIVSELRNIDKINVRKITRAKRKLQRCIATSNESPKKTVIRNNTAQKNRERGTVRKNKDAQISTQKSIRTVSGGLPSSH